jgi:hypothetical protein
MRLVNDVVEVHSIRFEVRVSELIRREHSQLEVLLLSHPGDCSLQRSEHLHVVQFFCHLV